jgi:hypothetical protein
MRTRRKGRPLRTAAILSALVAALILASSAQAACGGAVRYEPTASSPFRPPPLAVGDSIMLGAVGPLRRRGFEVDVRGCRQMSEGLGVIRGRGRSLPRFVVIGLGTNWTVTLDQIRQALRIVGRERVLGLVTPREVGGVRSSDQAVMRQAGRRWPNRVRVIDWVARSAGHSDWFWSDGLHLRPKGARAMARLIRGALTVSTTQEPEPEPPSAPAPGGGVTAPGTLSAGFARGAASG